MVCLQGQQLHLGPKRAQKPLCHVRRYQYYKLHLIDFTLGPRSVRLHFHGCKNMKQKDYKQNSWVDYSMAEET